MIDHFAATLALGLSAADRSDPVVYQPCEHDGIAAALKEVNDFARVLRTAIPAHDGAVVALAAHTIGSELRDLAEHYPGLKDTTVVGGVEERLAARRELKDLVVLVRRIGVLAADGHYDEADAAYLDYRKLMFQKVPFVLEQGQPWSLFNPAVHDAHFAALRQLLQSAGRLQRRSLRCTQFDRHASRVGTPAARSPEKPEQIQGVGAHREWRAICCTALAGVRRPGPA